MAEAGSDFHSAGHPRPGCPLAGVRDKLRQAGLRPTRQRICLGWLLFGQGDRHVTAELLFGEAQRARIPATLATVYNTLKQFTDAGLVRPITVEGRKTYFDTDVTDHHHFLIEGEEIMDIPSATLSVIGLPAAPDGYEIGRIDVIVRLHRSGIGPARELRPGPGDARPLPGHTAKPQP